MTALDDSPASAYLERLGIDGFGLAYGDLSRSERDDLWQGSRDAQVIEAHWLTDVVAGYCLAP